MTYFKTHAGHIPNPFNTNVPRGQLKQIEDKIAMGVDPKRVFRDNRASNNVALKMYPQKNYNYWVNKNKLKDRNRSGMLHIVDKVSCTLALLHLQKSNKRGLFYNNLDDINSLKDAIIVVANERQLELLKEYGKEHIMIDSTFGIASRKYDLKLTPIMSIDKYGSGVVVCYIISRKLNSQTWQKCFNKLKDAMDLDKGEKFTPKIFMTDDDSSYYNAWCNVFGEPRRKLLCTWHIGRSWKKQLAKKGCSSSEKSTMLLSLIDLKSIIYETNFKKRCNVLLQRWNKGSLAQKRFCTYFKKYYMYRVREWADCYRKKAGLGTNNYLESYFSNLKTNILGGNRNIRLDVLLFKLFIKSQDEKFEFIIKENNGVLFKEEANRIFHNMGQRIPMKDFFRKSKNVWHFKLDSEVKLEKKIEKINSGDANNDKGVKKRKAQGVATALKKKVSNKLKRACNARIENDGVKKRVYIVKMKECDDCKCLKRCKYCKACVLRFECTCRQYIVNNNLCKHIHRVCLTPEVRAKLGTDNHQTPWKDLKYPSLKHLSYDYVGELDTDEKIKDECLFLCDQLKKNVTAGPSKNLLMKKKRISKLVHLNYILDGKTQKQVPDQQQPPHQIRYQG